MSEHGQGGTTQVATIAVAYVAQGVDEMFVIYYGVIQKYNLYVATQWQDIFSRVEDKLDL